MTNAPASLSHRYLRVNVSAVQNTPNSRRGGPDVYPLPASPSELAGGLGPSPGVPKMIPINWNCYALARRLYCLSIPPSNPGSPGPASRTDHGGAVVRATPAKPGKGTQLARDLQPSRFRHCNRSGGRGGRCSGEQISLSRVECQVGASVSASSSELPASSQMGCQPCRLGYREPPSQSLAIL